MSITASRPRGVSLPGDHYICTRCGREGKYNYRRGRPQLCRDCLYVQNLHPPTETEQP